MMKHNHPRIDQDDMGEREAEQPEENPEQDERETEQAELVEAIEVNTSPMEGVVLPPEPAVAIPNLPEGAKISFVELGKARAVEITKLDEAITAERTSLRGDILKVLAGPTDSYATYVSGFTLVMAERESKGKDTRSLRNVKSQVTRVLVAAKANLENVKALLTDNSKRWEVVLKALPKRSNAGRPASGSPGQAAGEGVNLPSPAQAAATADGEVSENNIGTLVIAIRKIAERLREVSVGKHSPFGEYMALNVLAMLETAQSDYHKCFTEQQSNGAIKDIHKFRVALGLEEEKKAA